jgi:serine/threonine protein kinase
MEDRYEIRGKIGQGGLGAVYRGYDTRMSREVAIKRISVTAGDPELLEESTRQLIKEAGALASLQHPNIVTVYDVGADQDGPYVVMELITGKTLDELIELAPLTWPDFRELALQTLEALIAAQELGLIHSDIKPSNLMLTWLPSGKFQMKIVDFGLATLNHSQSLEDLQEIESVFGSIFFMAPEQFERIPIDARSDLYAMGCVYYQALTGKYPFNGETSHDVIDAHLHHRVIPLQELRSEIPLWVCDWIMWLINRMPVDRPESARDALLVFFKNDKNPSPTMSLGTARPAAPSAPRARMVVPAAQPAAPTKRLATNLGMAPSAPVLTSAETAPQPLLPPEGSKPSIYTSSNEIPEFPPPTPTSTSHGQPTRPQVSTQTPKNSDKRAKIAITSALFLVIAVLGFILSNRIKQSKASQRYGIMLADAANNGTTEIPMTGAECNHFLEMAANADTDEKQKNIFKALALAKASDNSDIDASLTEFATTSTQILPEVREAMILEVLAKRANSAMAPSLLEFARTSPDVRSAIAAMQILGTIAGDAQFESLLTVVQFSPNGKLRAAAEDAATAILKKSRQRGDLAKLITKALEANTDGKVRDPLLRLQAAGR